MECPFCHEDDFDEIGLKRHLLSGWCEVFNNTISTEEERDQRSKEDIVCPQAGGK